MAIDRTAYNALIDDDSSNLIGTPIVKNTIKTVLLDPIDVALLDKVIASTAVGAQNNWAPGLNGHTLITWAGASALAVTGFAAGVAGQRLVFKNTSSQVATFAHNSGSSSAGNKLFNIATSGVTPVAAGGAAVWIHDGTQWQMVAHDQGAPIAWVPADGSGASLAFTNILPLSVLRGLVVQFSAQVVYPVTVNGANAKISGLPFMPSNRCAATSVIGNVDVRLAITNGAAVLDFFSPVGAALTNAQVTGINFFFSGTYFTS